MATTLKNEAIVNKSWAMLNAMCVKLLRLLKWYFDQIFTPCFFLVYYKEFHERMKTPFEKWVKYANEMADDVIHSIFIFYIHPIFY